MKIDKIREVSRRYGEHHITAFSAQMAFFLFLSIFPLAMFILSLASRLNLDTELFILSIQKGLPLEVSNYIINLIEDFLINDSISLLSISGLTVLWSASRGINALMRGFNIAYGYKETRNYLRLKITGMFYTLVLIISIIVTIALPSIGADFFSFIKKFIPVSNYLEEGFYLVRILLNILVYFFFILSMHKVLPAGKLKYRNTIYGGIFSIVGWFVLSKGFGFFVSSFTNYAAVYGGLASIVTLMMWLYFTSTVMMIGAEINSVIIEYKNRKR